MINIVLKVYSNRSFRINIFLIRKIDKEFLKQTNCTIFYNFYYGNSLFRQFNKVQPNNYPPVIKNMLNMIQHLLLSLGGSIGPIVILAKSLCIADTEEGIAVKAKLVGSVLAVNGIASFLQATFGTRL